jgi:hypothetical protein
MNKMGLILVHFDRQMTESEFFDAMSEVYERNGTKKFFVDGIHSVVARNILDSGREDDTISLIVSDDDLITWEGYCSLSWYKEHGYERAPVYTIDEFIDVFRPDLREPIIFEDELMALIGG